MPSVPWAEPVFTFQEVLEATGADNAWLRTLLQRDKDGLLGTKHRTGRLLFSLKDIAAVGILWGLNTNIKLPPAAAWDVVNAASAVISGSGANLGDADLHVAFNAKIGVLVWTIRDGLVITWNDNADKNQYAAFQANQGPHIVYPMKAILAPVGHAAQIVASWPAKDRGKE